MLKLGEGVLSVLDWRSLWVGGLVLDLGSGDLGGDWVLGFISDFKNYGLGLL